MGRLATARRIKTAGRPRQPLLRQNRRFSSPHPFGRAGRRDSSRAAFSTSERRLPGENVCYLRNLGTDEPLTSMNGMARGRATSSLSQNRQNRRNREPTRTGSRSGSCTHPRHRPHPGQRRPRSGAPGTVTARSPWPRCGSRSPRRGPRPAPTSVPARPAPAATRHGRPGSGPADPAGPPRAARHPPIVPAAFRKLDALAVLTGPLLPAPLSGSARGAPGGVCLAEQQSLGS